MTTGLKVLYIGGAVLAAVALLGGSYDYFVVAREGRSLVGDVIVPLGAFVVILVLYRRRKADLEQGSPLH
jgi:hypothetical protein